MGVINASFKGKSQASFLQKITSGEFDAVLVVEDDVLANLPGPAAKALSKTKIVYVGSPGGLTDKKAAISIHTTDMIIAGSGTMTRVDMKDIQFKKWTASKDGNTNSDILLKLKGLVSKK